MARPGDGEIAGGKGTEAFLEMMAVALDIQQIVDHVVGRGDEAEADEGFGELG